MEQAKAQAQGVEIVHFDDLHRSLAQLLSEVKARRVAFEGRPRDGRGERKLREAVPDVAWEPAENWVEELRAVKEPREIEAIKRR